MNHSIPQRGELNRGAPLHRYILLILDTEFTRILHNLLPRSLHILGGFEWAIRVRWKRNVQPLAMFDTLFMPVDPIPPITLPHG